ARIAEALVRLDGKIADRKLNQDRNWDDRVTEVYKQLVSLDADLPAALVKHKDFGRSGHVIFLSEIGSGDLPAAIEAFLRQIRADSNFRWTNGVIFLLAESQQPEHRAMLREKYSDFAL